MLRLTQLGTVQTASRRSRLCPLYRFGRNSKSGYGNWTPQELRKIEPIVVWYSGATANASRAQTSSIELLIISRFGTCSETDRKFDQIYRRAKCQQTPSPPDWSQAGPGLSQPSKGSPRRRTARSYSGHFTCRKFGGGRCQPARPRTVANKQCSLTLRHTPQHESLPEFQP